MAVPSSSKERMEQSGPETEQYRSSPSRTNTKLDSDGFSDTSSVHSTEPPERKDIDILAQVLSTRSEEYRLLFRLPPDEVLVQDYNCALQENILLQGHMYLFLHHICFYSNIFGFETKKTIPFHEVTFVQKAKTVAIFPNAIEIATGAKKHFFGSFLSRDEAYRLIIDGWSQHNSDAKAFLDHQESKSENNCQDNGLVILDTGKSSRQSVIDLNSIDSVPSKLLEAEENGEENAECSSSGQSFTWQLEDVDAPKVPEHFTMVIEAKFPLCVRDFFHLFFSDGATDFLESYHTKCGDKDFRCTPWQRHKKFGHIRDLSFQHPIKIYFGAKFGTCQEIQKLRVYRNSHFVIETSQQVSDVPYGDYFHVEGLWDVEQDGEGESGCILRAYVNVAFSRKTMWKGKIEQSTREEYREVFGIWVNNVHELLKQKTVAEPEGVAVNSVNVIEDNNDVLEITRSPTQSEEMVTDAKDYNLQASNPLQEWLRLAASMASFLKESCATLSLHLKSQNHNPLFLVIAFVSILFIMQVCIMILLTRTPEVHLISHGGHTSGFSSDRSETINWLEKRVYHLNEEMLIMETRLDRMRQEYLLLKEHLQSLQRLKPS